MSAVASKKEALNDMRAISLDRRLYMGVSTSPSDASCAKFSRKRFRFRDLDPDNVLGVVFVLLAVGVSTDCNINHIQISTILLQTLHQRRILLTVEGKEKKKLLPQGLLHITGMRTRNEKKKRKIIYSVLQ